MDWEAIRKSIQNLLGLETLPDGENLEGLSVEQLKEADTKAREVFTAAKAEKDKEITASALEVVKAINAEFASRKAESDTADAEFAAMEAEMAALEGGESDAKSDTEKDGEGDGDDGDAGDDAGDGDDGDAGDGADSGDGADADAKADVTADAKPRKTKVLTPAPSKAPEKKIEFSIVASADNAEVATGASMSIEETAKAFEQRLGAARQSRIGAPARVAQVQVEYTHDRTLNHEDFWTVNQAKIDAVTMEAHAKTNATLKAIQAAGRDTEQIMELAAEGGLCAPVTVRYDICQQGDDYRPLRDSLVRFGATRGGIQFNIPPSLADAEGSVQRTTEAEDTTGAEYPKDCLRVDCGELTSQEVAAISLCMEVGNFQRISYPENFRAWWHYGNVAHSRVAETALWDGMIADPLTTARLANSHSTVGAMRNTLAEIGRYVKQYKFANRIRPETPMRLWIPEWLMEVLRTDMTFQAPGDSAIDVSDADIIRFFARRGVAITQVADGQSPGSGDDEYPTSVTVILAVEGTFLFLDMGVLNFGTEIRDFTQIRNNDSGAFMETFENVKAVCNGAQAITLPLCANGETAGPIAEPIVCES